MVTGLCPVSVSFVLPDTSLWWTAGRPPGWTGETSLCRNPEDSKRVEHATTPAAKRRHRKARHVSAGKQMWNKVESRRDGTVVATQTRTAPEY